MALQPNYSNLDRLLHRVAFATPAVQLTAADVERKMFSSSYAEVRGDRPIFITSLPRAGTTLMLEALHRFPSLASHLYRDMPFVMAPVLWSQLTGAFRKPSERRERAHGDGMDVGYDSPEALEEILWRIFWPDKYTESGIALWAASDDKPEARDFFADLGCRPTDGTREVVSNRTMAPPTRPGLLARRVDPCIQQQLR